MKNERRVRLFRIGRTQAVRIPREFELPGKEVVMRKECTRLIIEPKARTKTRESLLALLATWEPIDERFPEIPDLPAEPVDL
jgi:antitoxin VapB